MNNDNSYKYIVRENIECADKAIGALLPNTCVICMSNGTWSFLSAIDFALWEMGESMITISSLAVSRESTKRIKVWSRDGRTYNERFILDRSFEKLGKGLSCKYLRDTFGDNAIRILMSNSKWCLLSNNERKIVIQSSSNLNESGKSECFMVYADGYIPKLYSVMVGELWEAQDAGSLFDRGGPKAQAHTKYFIDNWSDQCNIKESARIAFKGLESGGVRHGLNGSRWTFRDAIKRLVWMCGKSHVLVSANVEKGYPRNEYSFLSRENVLSFRLLCDNGFMKNNFDFFKFLDDKFGSKGHWTWDSNMNFAIVLGDKMSALYITSANLSANKRMRIENWSLFLDKKIVSSFFSLVKAVISDYWSEELDSKEVEAQ